MAVLDRPQMIIWRIRIECCITKATNTHSECFNADFSYNNCCMNIFQCYVYSTSLCLLSTVFVKTLLVAIIIEWQ